MVTVNFTIELESDEELLRFECWLGDLVKVKDLTILTDTKELYESDSTFRKLTKAYKDARRLRNDYINSKL
jgi:hypothetical protein